MAAVYNSQLDAFELHHIIQETPQTTRSTASHAILASLGHAVSGCVGASISNVATYPLDLIITRLQIQRQLRRYRKDNQNAEALQYRGVRDAAQKIYENEGGVKGFYVGVYEDTAKTVADSFLFFLLYSFLRERRIRRSGLKGHLPALEELSVGFVAGALTKLCTAPIANIVTRTQARAMVEQEGKEGKTGAREIAREIMQEKGLPGFWAGYSASLILTLNPSLTFFLFEMLKRMTLPRDKREKPPPAMTFLLSALSKSVASSVTYPFSLAKSRLQVGGGREAEQEKEEVEKDVSGNMRRKAVQDTIFSTIFTIVEREGWQSLYEGLRLEICKGFFSHGITMAVKQSIQRLVVKLWYLMSVVFGRYRRKLSGKKLRERARENVEYYNLAMARAGEKIEQAVDVAKSKANATAEFVAEYIEEDDGEWRDLYGTTGLAKWLGGDRSMPE